VDEGQPAGRHRGRNAAGRPSWPTLVAVPALTGALVVGLLHVGGWVAPVGLLVVVGLLVAAMRWVGDELTTSHLREERMRVMIDSLPDTFVLVVDTGLRFVDASGSFPAALDWAGSDLVGRSVTDVIEPRDDDRWLTGWRAAVAGEHVHFDSKGARSGRFIDVDIAPLRHRDGQIVGAMAVVRDINDRRVAAEALMIERTRAQAAFDAAPFGVTVIDPTTQTWLAVNEGMGRLLGYPTEELIGQRVYDFSHPDDLGIGAGSVEELLAVGDVQTIEKRYLRSDGSVLWARVSARVRQVDGEPTLVIAHTEDITEQREAEAALARSESRARTVLSALHEGIIVRDGESRVIEWNDALLEMVMLTPAQLLGEAPVPEGWRIVHPTGETMRRGDHPDTQVASDGKPRIGVPLGIARPGLPTRWFRVNAVPLDAMNGSNGIITSFVEETERLAAEREVELARDRFTALVEHSNDLVSVLVPGSDRFTYASPAWDRMLGWDPTTLDLDGLASAIHPDDLTVAVDTMLDVIAEPGRTRTFVMRVLHADGTWRYLGTTCTNLVDNEAIGGVVVNSNDVTEQVLAAAELADMAMHDGLTGLPNRRLVLDRISQALEEQRRTDTTVAVLFLDLDDFKGVNDAYGHAAGDQLLVTVGKRLSDSVRSMDTVGRIGGDEFVIVAMLRELDGAASIARHIEDALDEPIDLGPNRLVQTRASIGVVASRPDRPRTADEMLAEADSAMYEVKRRRRHLRAVT